MNLVRRFLSAYRPSRAVQVRPLELDRDWPEVQALLAAEGWPFVRGDLEVGAAQPHAAGFAAHVDGVLAGFFTMHSFGSVGYFDLFIVHPDHRNGAVAHALFTAGDRFLSARTTGTVVHSTNDSAPFIRLLGFRRCADFVLLTRAPTDASGALQTPDRARLLELEQAVFGASREPWITALEQLPGVRWVELDGATTCLRPRVGALALDAVCSHEDDAIAGLVRGIVCTEGDKELQCFARLQSVLHEVLLEQGFVVPAFFEPIGPLIEWRHGETGRIGRGDRVQSLMWL